MYRQQRRYREAIQVLDRALALAPSDFSLAAPRAAIDAAMSADLRPVHELTRGEAIKSANPNEAAAFRMEVALGQRDYQAAREALSADQRKEMTGPAGYVVPREWLEGLIALGLGNPEQAQASFLIAREKAARRVQARPNDGIALVALAQIGARLGRKAEALSEADWAMELHAATGDQLSATTSANRVAGIYAQVGEIDRALDLLEQAAKRPNGPTYGSLKLNEEWDPLRSHPRFEKLLAALAPKDAPPRQVNPRNSSSS
jgi:adenylate cyclase